MPRKSWWARLPFGVRMTAGTSALLLVLGAGVTGVAVLTQDNPDAPRIVTAIGQAAAPVLGAEPPAPAPPPHLSAEPGLDPVATLSRTTGQADRTGPRDPHGPAEVPPAPVATTTAQAAAPAKPVPAPPRPAKPAPARPGPAKPGPAKPGPAKPAPAKPQVPDSRPPAAPSITTRTDVDTREVPFQTRFVRDPSLPRGARKVTVAGVPGEESLRYLVTLTDGQETDRKLLDITVTREPQHRVIALGSRWGFGDRPRRGRDECGRKLDFCLPLGRVAQPQCPDEEPEADELSVLDQDIELLDLDLDLDLDVPAAEPAQMDCAVEPEIPRLPQ
ncbi:G5 domain-containing protein [Actinoplanes sp. TRM 88003]|uniref:G5 domain-containing protein n=1 Tax=Paractinoplanes aksuensis TaxID=2939490 RepID=A0ABT1DNE7_9ACTN|nr:G5 domain-containing protein [Actinoplanes aksuensis]MCO8272357.1 G5 domain-containing protein [Actinoplanes aksuensis]